MIGQHQRFQIASGHAHPDGCTLQLRKKHIFLSSKSPCLSLRWAAEEFPSPTYSSLMISFFLVRQLQDKLRSSSTSSITSAWPLGTRSAAQRPKSSSLVTLHTQSEVDFWSQRSSSWRQVSSISAIRSLFRVMRRSEKGCSSRCFCTPRSLARAFLFR